MDCKLIQITAPYDLNFSVQKLMLIFNFSLTALRHVIFDKPLGQGNSSFRGGIGYLTKGCVCLLCLLSLSLCVSFHVTYCFPPSNEAAKRFLPSAKTMILDLFVSLTVRNKIQFSKIDFSLQYSVIVAHHRRHVQNRNKK